jgi:hypothetical protein
LQEISELDAPSHEDRGRAVPIKAGGISVDQRTDLSARNQMQTGCELDEGRIVGRKPVVSERGAKSRRDSGVNAARLDAFPILGLKFAPDSNHSRRRLARVRSPELGIGHGTSISAA